MVSEYMMVLLVRSVLHSGLYRVIDVSLFKKLEFA
jgi:hypothetical protein